MKEEKTYTVKEVSTMFGKVPSDITAKVKAGGIKGVKVQPTDNGVEYLLTEKSINQLGALFGIVPKPIEESERMIDIDGKALNEAIAKSGYTSVVMSKATGKADNYLSNCIGRNRINVEIVEKIKYIFGLDIRKYEVTKKEENSDVKLVSAERKESTVDTEAIRSAVYNGLVDADLLLVKDKAFKVIIRDCLADEEIQKELTKCLFNAINGVRVKADREQASMHFGLVPQKEAN